MIDTITMSYFQYPYSLLFDPVPFQKIYLADQRDIAAMKLDTIASRGSRKDFIDLYEFLKTYSIQEILNFFEKKYANLNYNKFHLLKSLTYFNDAETDPMPVMLKQVDWPEVKNTIRKKVTTYLKEATNNEP